MNKKVIAATLLLSAPVAWSGPYVGVGYQAGAARVERDSLRNPDVDGRTLDQSDHESSSSPRLLAGYRFSDRWAVELAFQQPDIETSIEERVDGTGDDEEWESSIDAMHLTLAPVFLHPLGERIELRLSAGVLYGDYDLDRTHSLDVDGGPDQTLSRVSDSTAKVGAVVGAGVAMRTPWKFDVVAEVLHQRTRILSNTSLSLGAVYRF